MKVCDCPSCNYYRAVKERNDRIAEDRRIRDGIEGGTDG